MEETVGWITLSFINVAIAQSKNRTGLGWWLTSLLIGPFATFLLITFCSGTLDKNS
jgi:hypothetical protein